MTAANPAAETGMASPKDAAASIRDHLRTRAEKLGVPPLRIAVGHSGDEIGDVAAPLRLVARALLGPAFRHARGIGLIGGEEIGNDMPSLHRRRELRRVMVELGIHEALEASLLLHHPGREASDLP